LPDFLGFSCFIELQTALKFVKGKKFMDDKNIPSLLMYRICIFKNSFLIFFIPLLFFSLKKRCNITSVEPPPLLPLPYRSKDCPLSLSRRKIVFEWPLSIINKRILTNRIPDR